MAVNIVPEDVTKGSRFATKHPLQLVRKPRPDDPPGVAALFGKSNKCVLCISVCARGLAPSTRVCG